MFRLIRLGGEMIRDHDRNGSDAMKVERSASRSRPFSFPTKIFFKNAAIGRLEYRKN